MKRIISCLMAVLISAGVTASCKKDVVPENKKNDKLKITCSIFPVYDWVKNILGSKLSESELTLILDTGVDLHSFQPTADDIIGISESDVVIYVGGVSDKWIEDAVSQSQKEEITEINLMEVLGDRVKDLPKSKTEDRGHEHDEEHSHEGRHDKEEHIWISLKNAAVLTEYICEKLCEIDKENAGSYRENTKKYLDRLNELDNRYQETIESSEHKTVIFGDRFPFLYLTEDYGLGYFAAFSGCSAETESSFETVAFLSDKLDELGLSYILTIENANHNIAETIVKNTKNKNQKVLVMNSMQSTTYKDIESGANYLSIMESNLEVLKTALN